MAKFVMSRNLQVRSTSGYAVVFEKGVETEVPAVMIAEVIALGAERVDAGQSAHIKEPNKFTPPVGDAREGDIRAAIDAIVEQNNPVDFTASGVPKLAAISKMVGYAVDKVELANVWQKTLDEKAQ